MGKKDNYENQHTTVTWSKRPDGSRDPNSEDSPPTSNGVSTDGEVSERPRVRRMSKQVQRKMRIAPSAFKVPDGGWGWAVVFSSFMVHVIADGVTYAFGVLTPVIVNHYQSTREMMGWLASIMVGFTLASGPLASVLSTKYGFRSVTILGAILSGFGFAAIYVYDSLWFLFLTAGFITGVGFGLIYLPAIVTVGMYFEKKRSIAIGLAVCGSGIGTFIFGPFMEYLLEHYDWRGTMFITGAIIFNCIACGVVFRPLPIYETSNEAYYEEPIQEIDEEDNLLPEAEQHTNEDVPPRADSCPDPGTPTKHGSEMDMRGTGMLTPMAVSYLSLAQPNISHPHLSLSSMLSVQRLGLQETKPKSDHQFKDAFFNVFDKDLFKNPVFLLFALSNIFTSLGFNAPFLYVKDRAIQQGYPSHMGSKLISAIGIGNTLGRVIFGALASRSWVNRLYLYNTALVLCGACTMLSSLCVTFPWMVAYCVGFGSLIGVYVTLTSVVLVDLLGVEKLNESFGLIMLFQGIAVVVGPPMAGMIYDKTGSYDASFWVCGAMIGISGLMLYPVPICEKIMKRRRNRQRQDSDRSSCAI